MFSSHGWLLTEKSNEDIDFYIFVCTTIQNLKCVYHFDITAQQIQTLRVLLPKDEPEYISQQVRGVAFSDQLFNTSQLTTLSLRRSVNSSRKIRRAAAVTIQMLNFPPPTLPPWFTDPVSPRHPTRWTRWTGSSSTPWDNKNSTGRTYPFPEADPVSTAGADRGVECGRVRVRRLLPALDAVEGEEGGLTGVTTTLAVAMFCVSRLNNSQTRNPVLVTWRKKMFKQNT